MPVDPSNLSVLAAEAERLRAGLAACEAALEDLAMSEATPTPWHVGTSGDVYSGVTGGLLIASVSHNANGPNAPSSKPANGRLIVHAVNAYERLRAGLARAAIDVDNLATRIGLQDLGSPWSGELGRIAQAAAALLETTAADGESPT